MAQALGEEAEVVQAVEGVDEDLVGFCAECEEFPTRTHLDGKHFIRVRYFCDGGCLVAVPEVDWGSLSTGD